MARLRIQFRGAETVVHLGEGETTVGRSNRCTIHLPDPQLGEIHFRIRPKDGGFRLKDDGSGSGTRVNGKEVFATSLGDGDVIEAGSLRCEFITKEGARKRRALAAAAPPPPRSLPLAQRPAPANASPSAPPFREPRRANEVAAERTPRSRREPRPRSKLAIVGMVLGGAIAVGAVVALLLKGDGSEEANALLAEAKAAMATAESQATSQPLADARTALVTLRREYAKTTAASAARPLQVRLDRLTKVLESLDEADLALRSDMTPETAQLWFRRLAPLVDGTSEAVRSRLALALDQLREAERARAERAYAAVDARVREHLAAKRFGKARTLWLEFQTDDATCHKRAKKSLRELEAQVSAEYRALLGLAGKSDDWDVRIGLLEASRQTFRGTPLADDLEVRISALHARRRQAQYIVVKRDLKPKKGTDGGTQPPVEAGPYVEPDKVDQLVKQRRYAEAAAMLASITRHPVAKIRGEELTLLAQLMADLVARIDAAPVTFTKIRLPAKDGRADAVRADKNGLTVRRDDGEKTYAWTEIPAKSFVLLFRQAGMDKPVRLATALFFDEEMLVKDADKRYIDFFKSEQAPTTFTRILSRRRGIERPAGGFVLFRKRLVTPAERDNVLLAERIAKIVRDASRAGEKRRLGLWAELEQIGAPATDALADSIRLRRAAAVEELTKSKAFSTGRYAKLFGPKLHAARKNALAFILNPQQYPYPNKSDAAQQRAEELVSKVRVIWEEPYPLMLEASESAQALDAEIRALDDRLARTDPLAAPVYDEAIARVLKGLDVRTIPMQGFSQNQIQYNLDVEKYNRELGAQRGKDRRAPRACRPQALDRDEAEEVLRAQQQDVASAHARHARRARGLQQRRRREHRAWCEHRSRRVLAVVPKLRPPPQHAQPRLDRPRLWRVRQPLVDPKLRARHGQEPEPAEGSARPRSAGFLRRREFTLASCPTTPPFRPSSRIPIGRNSTGWSRRRSRDCCWARSNGRSRRCARQCPTSPGSAAGRPTPCAPAGG